MSLALILAILSAIFILILLQMPSFAALLQSFIIGLTLSSVYILMGLGMTLLFGMMHILNMAHGAIYMLGAYAIYYLFQLWGIPYPVAMLLAILIFAAFGVIIERGLYRPTGGRLTACVAGFLGLDLLLTNGAPVVFGVLEKGVDTIFPGLVDIGPATISVERLTIIPIAAALVVMLFLFLYRTNAGQSMRAIEQDREAASLQGVNVNRTNALAFGIGFGLAAAAGGLVAPMLAINAAMGAPLLLKVFIIIIIGGLGSLGGSIIAGLIIGLGESMGTVALGSNITIVLMFLLVMLFLLFRPRGILGRA